MSFCPNWERLVERYADGRAICNCGSAYYTPCGRGVDAAGNEISGALVCKDGCSANQMGAREEIAGRVLEDFVTHGVPAPEFAPPRPGRHAVVVTSQIPHL